MFKTDTFSTSNFVAGQSASRPVLKVYTFRHSS